MASIRALPHFLLPALVCLPPSAPRLTACSARNPRTLLISCLSYDFGDLSSVVKGLAACNLAARTDFSITGGMPLVSLQ